MAAPVGSLGGDLVGDPNLNASITLTMNATDVDGDIALYVWEDASADVVTATVEDTLKPGILLSDPPPSSIVGDVVYTPSPSVETLSDPVQERFALGVSLSNGPQLVVNLDSTTQGSTKIYRCTVYDSAKNASAYSVKVQTLPHTRWRKTATGLSALRRLKN